MSDQWATPQDIFDKLHAEFSFTLDVCAQPHNNKCPVYFTPEQDGLKQEWRGICWMNPPYGREIRHWMQKAYLSAQDGATIVALVPGRTNPPWWHDYVMHSSEVRFIRSKVAFVGDKDGVPFTGAVIVVFRPRVNGHGPAFSSWSRPERPQ